MYHAGHVSACEIVTLGPSHRLASGSDEVALRCSVCGDTWYASARQQRRIEAGMATDVGPCCRRRRPTPTEAHRLYWLRIFGADLCGRDARTYVREEGLPPELAEIVADLEPYFERFGLK